MDIENGFRWENYSFGLSFRGRNWPFVRYVRPEVGSHMTEHIEFFDIRPTLSQKWWTVAPPTDAFRLRAMRVTPTIPSGVSGTTIAFLPPAHHEDMPWFKVDVDAQPSDSGHRR